MSTLETRLESLERTIRRQRLGMLAALLVAVVAWSAGAISQPRTEDAVRAKQLIIEGEGGKTIGYFGEDGDGGVMLAMLPDPTNKERCLKLTSNAKESTVLVGFGKPAVRISANETMGTFGASSNDGTIISITADDFPGMTINHKGEEKSRVLVASSPKDGPGILLRNSDGSIRWKSSK